MITIKSKTNNLLKDFELKALNGGTEAQGNCYVCQCVGGVGTWYVKADSEAAAEQSGIDKGYCGSNSVDCSPAGSPSMCLA